MNVKTVVCAITFVKTQSEVMNVNAEPDMHSVMTETHVKVDYIDTIVLKHVHKIIKFVQRY